MKELLTLSIGILLLCSGCNVTSINVLDRKAPTRSASKILVVYLDEGCDLSLLDSNLYAICLRSCFLNSATVDLRRHVETVLAKNLATPYASVVKASSLFDTVNNSYAYFKRCLDSLGIDDILVTGLRSYSHIEHVVYTEYGPKTFHTENGNFVCYLFDTRSLIMPIWTAEIGGKGKNLESEKGLNRSMAQKVAAGLKASSYIAH
jgi:hypothetical protein